jgi:mRNA-degrading endonuclease RelE of RelBE toxin-antitoxin system
MPKRYLLEYEPEAVEHLKRLAARGRVCVVDAIDAHLSFQPTAVTKHRKLLRRNPLYPWQLSVGVFRIYYDVVDVPERMVRILALGVKQGNRLRIGDEEIKL